MSCCGSCAVGKPCESSCAAQGDDPNPFAADCDHTHPPEVPTTPCAGEFKSAKFERCVKAVKKRGGSVNPFAVYKAAVGEEKRRKSVTAAVAKQIVRHMQDDYDFAINAGHSPEEAEIIARQNAGDTFIVEQHYDKEGVWAAMGPLVGGRPGTAMESTNPFEAGETARVLYEAPREHAEERRRSPMVAGSCGPFARIERDPEVFAACRRMAESIGPIDDLEDAWHLAAPQLSRYDQEVGLVVCLSHQGELREVPVEISLGQRSRVAVDPADVLRAVILSGASSWIFLHCHPSGHSAKPSPADIELTKTLQRSNDAAFGKMRSVEPTVVFIGHGVVTAKELGDARTGKVKRMVK